MHFTLCGCECVLMCWNKWAYLKPVALGILGFISSSCVISTPAFQMVRQSDTVHKPASASPKSPLSQNSSGPLYLTDAEESLSHQGNTSRSATARDSGINKDGHLLTQGVHLGVFSWCMFRENRANCLLY